MKNQQPMGLSEASAEMPKYQCHKQVWALKIKSVKQFADETGDQLLEFENEKYSPIRVSNTYSIKHSPVAGGYYVQYKDGYTSFSPAKEFEDGYTLINK